MNMHVFIKGQLVITETNLAFARLYWEQRKALRPDLHITLVEVPKR